MKKYLTLNNLSYLVDKIKTYLTSSTYLNSIGIANSDIDDIADDAGYSSGSLPASEDIFITGDIIPNTDNSVDLGASSKNIKMLYTKGITINGTQFLPSNYMTLNTVQTVTSAKNYSGVQSINAYRLHIKNVTQEKGVIPASNLWNGITFNDKNDEVMFSIEQGVMSNGVIQINFSGRANDNNTTYTNFLRYINSSDLTTNSVNVIDLMPFGNGTRKLGDTNAKWKSFNGINPGALSLPSTYVNVDTTNWVLDGTPNIFTPASDGWLGIQATDTVYDQMHYVFVGRNDNSSYHSQNILSPINGLWLGSYHGCVFIPVIKNVRYDIRCICSNITATFYPCQGNV